MTDRVAKAPAAHAVRFAEGVRREALRELDKIAPSPQTLAEVAVLAKRVALAAYPRERVASLTGGPWLTFLDETGGTSVFTNGPGRYLESAAFERNPPTPGREELAELLSAIRHWIRRHQC